MKNYNKYRKNEGFSAVELLITIVVAALFIIALYELSILVRGTISTTRQKSVASELAYSYLRRYTGADTTPSTWFICSTAAGSSNTNDYTVNPNAAGQTIASGTLGAVDGLPGQVSYSVLALAVYGCSGGNSGTPIKVSARIAFGNNGATIEHSTLVGY